MALFSYMGAAAPARARRDRQAAERRRHFAASQTVGRNRVESIGPSALGFCCVAVSRREPVSAPGSGPGQAPEQVRGMLRLKTLCGLSLGDSGRLRHRTLHIG